MTNTFVSGTVDTITLVPDDNGNPIQIICNDREIPITWVVNE